MKGIEELDPYFKVELDGASSRIHARDQTIVVPLETTDSADSMGLKIGDDVSAMFLPVYHLPYCTYISHSREKTSVGSFLGLLQRVIREQDLAISTLF